MKKNIIILILFSITLYGQPAEEFPKSKLPFNPEQYVCYRTNEPIKIDGKMDESVWEKAQWTNYFVDIEGDLRPKPYYKTRAKMLWDDQYFYIAAKLEEEHIWAKLRQRDTVIFYDNDFEVFIDPDGDTHKYYEFEMNAFNTQWDLVLTKPYRDDNNVALNGWDIKGLKTAVDIRGTINNPEDKDEYWTLEIAFPWKALAEFSNVPSPPENGDQWRLGFSRVQWETEVVDGKYVKKINPQTGKTYPENNWIWSAQGIINMHAPETWGFVQFSTGIIGNEEVSFNYSTKEDAKWALRKVYYAEHDHKLAHGVFTNNYELLNIKDIPPLESYSWPPEINTTSTQFEAILKSKEGIPQFIIYQDGLIKEIDIQSKNKK